MDAGGRDVVDDAYLAEMPWAAAANEYPADWEDVPTHRMDSPVELAVYPAWIGYGWEGNILDCSLDEGVSTTPSTG